MGLPAQWITGSVACKKQDTVQVGQGVSKVVFTPDAKHALAVRIDLEGQYPHAISHVTVGDAPEGVAMRPEGNLAAALNVDGSNFKQAWFYHPTGSVTILQLRPIRISRSWRWTAPTWSIPANASKCRAIRPRCEWDHSAAGQFATDCTWEKLTERAPSCNWIPDGWLSTPVALPMTLVGNAVVVPSVFAAVTTT